MHRRIPTHTEIILLLAAINCESQIYYEFLVGEINLHIIIKYIYILDNHSIQFKLNNL